MTISQVLQAAFDASLHHAGAAARAERVAATLSEATPSFQITEDLTSIESEWRAFESRANCTPFQAFDWLVNWQRCIGSRLNVTPVIVTARAPGGELLFILPLAIEKLRYGRCLTFLGRALCDYNAPLLSPESAQTLTTSQFADLWKAVHGEIRRNYPHSFVWLDKMPKAVGGQPNPMCNLKVQRHGSSAHATELHSDWETFYSEKRSAATRRNDRKKLKKIAEFGTVNYRSPNNPEEIRELLSTLIEQKSTKFAKMGVANMFAKPGYTEFFTAIATGTGLSAHVSALQVGANVAAANLGLTYRGCYYHVLASYDDGPVARFGAGAAHLHELMRYAIGKRCTRFDFTIGDENYKRDWSDTELYLYDHVSGVGFVGRSVAPFVALALRVKRFIKTTPAIWALFMKLRALL